MFTKLESLRGVAACLVILYHSPFNFGSEPLSFFNNSYLFVDFFFILSGFVMSFAYGSKILNGLKFYKYISLRIGRIYPLHLFLLLAWIPYVILKQYLYSNGYGGTNQLDTSNIYSFISNLLLVHSMGVHNHLSWNYPSWSISTEFFAYISFFFITLTLDRKNGLILPILITIGSYLIIFNTNYPNLDITYDFGFFRCIGAFYIGVFLFRLKPKLTMLNSEKWMNSAEIFTILLLVLAVSFSNTNKPILALTILSFAVVLLVFSSSKSGFLGKTLETIFMREVGIRSYSIYMLLGITWGIILNIFIHLLGINPVTTVGFTSILVNLVVIAIILGLSKYTYLFVEKKFRDLIKQKLNY